MAIIKEAEKLGSKAVREKYGINQWLSLGLFLAEFYRDVMGMQIVGGSSADAQIGASAFLSSRPEEESHEIALFTNPEIRHVAFKVASLAELRSFYQRICARKLPVKMAANHGASLAFHFDDPDGNMIEVYWPTGVKYGCWARQRLGPRTNTSRELLYSAQRAQLLALPTSLGGRISGLASARVRITATDPMAGSHGLRQDDRES